MRKHASKDFFCEIYSMMHILYDLHWVYYSKYYLPPKLVYLCDVCFCKSDKIESVDEICVYVNIICLSQFHRYTNFTLIYSISINRFKTDANNNISKFDDDNDIEAVSIFVKFQGFTISFSYLQLQDCLHLHVWYVHVARARTHTRTSRFAVCLCWHEFLGIVFGRFFFIFFFFFSFSLFILPVCSIIMYKCRLYCLQLGYNCIQFSV